MKDIIVEIGTSVVCLFLASICFYVSKWFHNKCEELKSKTDNDAFKRLLEKIDYIVQIAVEATNQTFVDDWKKNGESLSDEQKQSAFNNTFESIDNMLTDEDKEKIIESFGDLGTFLRNSVETYIKNSKDI
jgi:hypothetical protein